MLTIEQKKIFQKKLTEGLSKNQEDKKNVLYDALKSTLEESKVPQSYLLKVVESLRKEMGSHKFNIEQWQAFLTEHKKHMQSHEERNAKAEQLLSKANENHSKQIESFEQELERHKQLKKGDDGYTPIKGKDYFDGESPKIEDVIAKVLPLIPKPKKGDKGKDADVDELTKTVITRIQKEKLIDLSHIKGAQGFIKDGVKYRFEELMHGGGGNSTGTTPKVSDLSSQCNGSNLIFTIPAFTTILTLIGTDAPIIYRPSVDFTATGTTLTLSGVNAPSNGATLLLTYV